MPRADEITLGYLSQSSLSDTDCKYELLAPSPM